jgi:hypothetical protein
LKAKQPLALICPLDWGLGHASRIIPLIRQYIGNNYRVVIGGSGKSIELLRTLFPSLSFIGIPAPSIRYSKDSRFLLLKLFLDLPVLITSVFREHFFIRKLIGKIYFDRIISDNRYGLFSKKVHSVLITHQISPVLPSYIRWMEFPLYLIIRRLIMNFNECLIPDFNDPLLNLSGKLSHRFALPENTRFVGVLSRFNKELVVDSLIPFEKYELVMIASGPEPQLTLFCQLLVQQVKKLQCKAILITGLCQNKDIYQSHAPATLTIVPHLEPDHFLATLLHAGIIVCRAGYSNIMDLTAIGRSAVLVPTPGQPEQEYLAEYLTDNGLFKTTSQESLDLGRILNQESFNGSEFLTHSGNRNV